MPEGTPRKLTLARRVRGGLAASTFLLVLAACAPKVGMHGHMVDIENLVEVEPGKTDKGRVLGLLGSPSSVSSFGPETWFYISRHTEQTAFFKAELIDQRVVYIAFDPSGVVDSVGKLDKDDGKRIEVVNRQTPTAGQRITFLQQLIGNIGRFNQPADAR